MNLLLKNLKLSKCFNLKYSIRQLFKFNTFLGASSREWDSFSSLAFFGTKFGYIFFNIQFCYFMIKRNIYILSRYLSKSNNSFLVYFGYNVFFMDRNFKFLKKSFLRLEKLSIFNCNGKKFFHPRFYFFLMKWRSGYLTNLRAFHLYIWKIVKKWDLIVRKRRKLLYKMKRISYIFCKILSKRKKHNARNIQKRYIFEKYNLLSEEYEVLRYKKVPPKLLDLKIHTNFFKISRPVTCIYTGVSYAILQKEARRFQIPVFSFLDGSESINKLNTDYPVFSNNSSSSSLLFYFYLFKNASYSGEFSFLKSFFKYKEANVNPFLVLKFKKSYLKKNLLLKNKRKF